MTGKNREGVRFSPGNGEIGFGNSISTRSEASRPQQTVIRFECIGGLINIAKRTQVQIMATVIVGVPARLIHQLTNSQTAKPNTLSQLGQGCASKSTLDMRFGRSSWGLWAGHAWCVQNHADLGGSRGRIPSL